MSSVNEVLLVFYPLQSKFVASLWIMSKAGHIDVTQKPSQVLSLKYMSIPTTLGQLNVSGHGAPFESAPKALLFAGVLDAVLDVDSRPMATITR